MRKVVIALLLFCSSAFAAAVTPSGWYGFGWEGNLPLTAGGYTLDPGSNPDDPPWTFTLAAPVDLMVVDAFNSGDRFEVFDNGVSLGLTSLAPEGFSECAGGDTPWNCLAATGTHSSGIFALGPGQHSITINVVSGLEYGAAWFGFSSVPEPASTLLVLTGSALLILARRRARRS